MYTYLFADQETELIVPDVMDQTAIKYNEPENEKSILNIKQEPLEPSSVIPEIETPEFECALCSKGFSTKKELYLHILAEHDYEDDKDETEEEARIPENNEKIQENPEKNKQEIHTNQEKMEEINQCPRCSKIFENDYILNFHLRNSHKVYQCTECTQHFKTARDLKQHSKTEHEVIEKSPKIEVGKLRKISFLKRVVRVCALFFEFAVILEQ